MGVGPLRPAVFLDRDGVINRAVVRNGRPHPPPDAARLEVLPGVPQALARLRATGFRLVVVTNQPDVARGTQTREGVEQIHARLAAELPIDEFRVCYHDDLDRCDCRKPAPGLLLAAARDAGIDLRRSVIVGDRWRDISAGRSAGCRTVFVDWHYDEALRDQPDLRVSSLADAVDWIIATADTAETDTPDVNALKIKIFADGADLADMTRLAAEPYIRGFTTNPTLMRKAGVTDYLAFAREAVRRIPDRSISFEVFSDEFDEMERQAGILAALGPHVYVKIPVTNTRREPAYELIRRLSHRGVQLNVTAVFTLEQVREVTAALAGGAPSILSVFAGRIADTGRDPVVLMTEALDITRPFPSIELLWASPRELLNIFQADAIGCHIITVTGDLLARTANVGKDLSDFSLETVKMFHDDARRAGFVL